VSAEVDAPALKIWSALQVLAVVVPKPREKLPVLLLYASGYVAESEVEEILLLKVVQSVDARKPLVEALACEMESVPAENESGPETVALLSCLEPLA
jgi:hypothetical protein